MKVYDAKNIGFRDDLAEKRRKTFVLKILFFIGLTIAIISLIFYFIFFSGFLDIKEVSVNGLDKVNKEEFNNRLDQKLNSKWFGLFEHQKNVIFFDSNTFRTEALYAFPEIKEISVNKRLPHTLNINVIERETVGIWCFLRGCKYFDDKGNTWGETIKSSGFLILNVEDLRQDRQGEIDKSLLGNLLSVLEYLKGLNIFINKFVIPNDFFGDFKVVTSLGFYLLLNTDSDIKEQLEILKIFLVEKQKESSPAGGFKPQYIDLRINGRIYYQ